jgi:hypothetical protein
MYFKFGVTLLLVSALNPMLAVGAQMQDAGVSPKVELRSGDSGAQNAIEVAEPRNGDSVGCSFKYALSETPAFLNKMWELYGPKFANEERWEQDLRDGIIAAKKGHWQETAKCCNLSLTDNQNAHDAMLLRSVANKKLNQPLYSRFRK